MTLTPAYGRDYKSVKEVKAAWEADQDFIIADFMHPYSGKPVNRAALRQSGEVSQVMIRYSGNRKVSPFKVT